MELEILLALTAWLASNGGASASDACGSVTWTNNNSGLSDLCGSTGTATVTFTATDACGNSLHQLEHLRFKIQQPLLLIHLLLIAL